MTQRRGDAEGAKGDGGRAISPAAALFGLGVGDFALGSFEQAYDGYADDLVSLFDVTNDYAVAEVDAECRLGRVYGYVEDVAFFVVAAF